jgi:hypothetical protein
MFLRSSTTPKKNGKEQGLESCGKPVRRRWTTAAFGYFCQVRYPENQRLTPLKYFPARREVGLKSIPFRAHAL